MNVTIMEAIQADSLHIVDKRGLPYENEEVRCATYQKVKLIEELWEEAAWALETTYTLPTREEMEAYIKARLIDYGY